MSPVDAVLRLWLVCYSCTTISQNLRMSLSLSSHHKSPEREHGCSSRLPEAQQVAAGKRQRPTPGVDLGSNPSGTSFLRLGKLLLGSWQLTGYATIGILVYTVKSRRITGMAASELSELAY